MKTSRTVLLASLAGVGLALSLATVAVSAGNPVEERQAAMKSVGQSMKEASALTATFDAAKAKASMDSVAGAAKKAERSLSDR